MRNGDWFIVLFFGSVLLIEALCLIGCIYVIWCLFAGLR